MTEQIENNTNDDYKNVEEECKFLTDTLFRISTGRKLLVFITAHMNTIHGVSVKLDKENKAFIIDRLNELTKAIVESPDPQEPTIQ